MEKQLRYLQLVYHPRTRPFIRTVEAVLKTTKHSDAEEVTRRIFQSLNDAGIASIPVATADDLFNEFPISKIYYNESQDRWFTTTKNRLMPVEELLETSAAKISLDALKAYSKTVTIQIGNTLDDARYDRALAWFDTYIQLRNDIARLVDHQLIEQILFLITSAIQTLAEIGNREFIEHFRKKYAGIKFTAVDLGKGSLRGLLSASENTFFDGQVEIAEKNKKIHTLCNDFEKKGGDIKETAREMKRLGVNLETVVPALLNLRINQLITEIKGYETGIAPLPDDAGLFESKLFELEALVEDDRVNAPLQEINKINPIYLKVLEHVFLDHDHPIDKREEALLKALERVSQKEAYANFQIGMVYQRAVQAAMDQNKEKMESHLSFYGKVMESHFGIFQKSMAQIKRETDEIRRAYQQKKIGLI